MHHATSSQDTPLLNTACLSALDNRRLPTIIQGGMGVAVSSWQLARAVAKCGQLGVVSGTAIDSVLARRLQDGDPEDHLRRAMAHFPFQDIVQDALSLYFLPGGREPETPYKRVPLHTVHGSRSERGLTVLGAFVEVFLAKEGHQGPIGINLLTRVQLPNLAALYGAMLAGIDYVLMGAGIHREIPGVLDRFARHQATSAKLELTGPTRDDEPTALHFTPAEFGGNMLEPLKRPAFLAIISSHSLATMLLKRATGSIKDFIIDGPTAGGHNAPPRGSKNYDAQGQPLYGERDLVDLTKIRELGLPFPSRDLIHVHPILLRQFRRSFLL